jgi:hypothetical protein
VCFSRALRSVGASHRFKARPAKARRHGCYLVCKHEAFFVLEQTSSERLCIQRTLKLLVYETMAN